MLSRPVLTSHTFLLCVYMIYKKRRREVVDANFSATAVTCPTHVRTREHGDTCVWHHCYLCGWRRRLPYSFELVTWWPPSAPAERDYGSPAKDNSRWQTQGFPILDCLTRVAFSLTILGCLADGGETLFGKIRPNSVYLISQSTFGNRRVGVDCNSDALSQLLIIHITPPLPWRSKWRGPHDPNRNRPQHTHIYI